MTIAPTCIPQFDTESSQAAASADVAAPLSYTSQHAQARPLPIRYRDKMLQRKKKALLIGIQYEDPKSKLDRLYTPHADVVAFRQLLVGAHD